MSDNWYVVPELEVRIHSSWIELIRHCQIDMPYGDLKIKIANALPTKRVKETPKIRFDNPMVRKTVGNIYVIKSTGDRVQEYWVNMIQWCQNYFQLGDIEVRIVNACPTELLSAKQEARFDKPDTLPLGEPLKFDKS